jgi:hypothetical protein
VAHGFFKVVVAERKDGFYLVGRNALRVYLQPQVRQLSLGFITVQGLGDLHGTFYYAGVPGLPGGADVIHQSDIVAATLGGNFSGQQGVQDFRLKITVFDGLAGLLWASGGHSLFPGVIASQTGTAREQGNAKGKKQRFGQSVHEIIRQQVTQVSYDGTGF